jgi:hypothetical protein
MRGIADDVHPFCGTSVNQVPDVENVIVPRRERCPAPSTVVSGIQTGLSLVSRMAGTSFGSAGDVCRR